VAVSSVAELSDHQAKISPQEVGFLTQISDTEESNIIALPLPTKVESALAVWLECGG
jgi:hypothetical protein